jgi:sodium-dependent dicarboxylate transporter 2/3/5
LTPRLFSISPTESALVGLIEKRLGVKIGFAEWSLYGLPIVLLGVPLAALIIRHVQKLGNDGFDPAAAREAIADVPSWTQPEKRLAVIFALALAAWIAQPWVEPMLPKGALTDGTIAVVAGLLLLTLPDGTGRPLLTWSEANRAPWDVILMFGGGLALAMGMTESGMARWLGEALLPLAAVPLPVAALLVVAMVVLITEFASNIAAASGIMPVVAALVVALGADPILLALPAAIAATWGFMLPSGTGPNAIAWSTGHIALPRMLRAGLFMDIAGVFLIVGVVWGVAAIAG